jgi:hypothetical protein
VASLVVSTAALSGDDHSYTVLENRIHAITHQRNEIASKIIQRLEEAEFNGKPVDHGAATGFLNQANELLQKLQK